VTEAATSPANETETQTQTQTELERPAPSAGAGPLAGLRVLELGGEQADYAGLLCAGLGATVIKVEPPDGSRSRQIGPFHGGDPDPERSLYFWGYNRGKRSVVIDLAAAEGRDRLRGLLAEADVLIDATSLGELAALQGVVKFPVRIKCATLSWITLAQGLDEAEQSTPQST